MRGATRAYLFCQFDLDSELRERVLGVQKEVDSINKNTFLSTPTEVIADNVVSGLILEPLQLHIENMARSEAKECDVDVTGDPHRYFSTDRGPHYVKGIRFSINIPFTGDSMLWGGKTNPWSSSLPVGEVKSNGRDKSGLLVMNIEVPNCPLKKAVSG